MGVHYFLEAPPFGLDGITAIKRYLRLQFNILTQRVDFVQYKIAQFRSMHLMGDGWRPS